MGVGLMRRLPDTDLRPSAICVAGDGADQAGEGPAVEAAVLSAVIAGAGVNELGCVGAAAASLPGVPPLVGPPGLLGVPLPEADEGRVGPICWKAPPPAAAAPAEAG